MSNFSPTDEQVAALNAFATGQNIVLSAFAGCLAAETIIHTNRAGKGHRHTIKQIARQTVGTPSMTRSMGGKLIEQGARKWDLSIPTFVARADGDISDRLHRP